MNSTSKPQTDQEIYLTARVEALQKRNAYLETELLKDKDILNGIIDDASQIEVINHETL